MCWRTFRAADLNFILGRAQAMSNNIEQLTQEILQICQGQEMGCVLSALRDATEQALRSVSHEGARAGFLITHSTIDVCGHLRWSKNDPAERGARRSSEYTQ